MDDLMGCKETEISEFVDNLMSQSWKETEISEFVDKHRGYRTTLRQPVICLRPLQSCEYFPDEL